MEVLATDLLKNTNDAFFTKNENYTGKVAYIMIRDKKDNGESPSNMTDNLLQDEQKTAMFWITPDNVQVTGVRLASIKNIDGVSSKGVAENQIKLQKFGIREKAVDPEFDSYTSTLTAVTGD